jgi:hypothetical protein
MDEPIPSVDPPEARHCAVCGEVARHGFGQPGFPLQPAEEWYCGAHRAEGERAWAARAIPLRQADGARALRELTNGCSISPRRHLRRQASDG